MEDSERALGMQNKGSKTCTLLLRDVPSSATFYPKAGIILNIFIQEPLILPVYPEAYVFKKKKKLKMKASSLERPPHSPHRPDIPQDAETAHREAPLLSFFAFKLQGRREQT